ncbi:MAG: Calx-beta domain-containing protein [Gammaproteobacteria bacterium]|jgi:hypothetical protein
MNKLYSKLSIYQNIIERFLVILAVSVALTACNEDKLELMSTMVSEDSGAMTDGVPAPDAENATDSVDGLFDVPVAEPVVFPLLAGQTIEVGTVTVTNTETSIIVVYETVDGWGITETHVDVALDYSGLHTNGPGNPVVGRFDQQTSHPEPVNQVVHMIEDLQWMAGTSIYIATHAVVTSQGLGTETAWAGDLDFPGRNWATYLGYTTQDVVQDDRGLLQFSDAVYQISEPSRIISIPVNIPVQRTDGSSGSISVDYRIVGGTATYEGDDPGNGDYDIDSLQGTLVFNEGDTEQVITITILDDRILEDPIETIELELFNSCCLGEPITAVVEIVDDEEPN